MEGVLDGDKRADCTYGCLVSILFLTNHPHHCHQSYSHLVNDIHLDVGKYHG